jgi:dihydroorotate dehydrogenase
MAVVACGAVGAFTAMSIYNENEQFYDDFLMPMIHMLDPETSHNVALTACKYKLFPKSKFKDLPSLVCIIHNL